GRYVGRGRKDWSGCCVRRNGEDRRAVLAFRRDHAVADLDADLRSGLPSSWISSKSDSPNADPAKPKVKAAASPTAIRRMAVPPQSPCSQELRPGLLAQL